MASEARWMPVLTFATTLKRRCQGGADRYEILSYPRQQIEN
jgi:hypothetical protein